MAEMTSGDGGAEEATGLQRRVVALEVQMAALTAELAAMRAAAGSATIVAPVGLKELPLAPVLRPPLAVPVGAAVPEPGMSVAPARQPSFETKFGAQVLSKVGVFLLLIGAAWFLKWAIDNRWIGPLGRVVAGLAAGVAVVVWSERFRRRGYAGFSYALKAVGSGVLYLSLWAAFQLYHLMPSWVALLAMIAITAWNFVMAWSQDAELLASFALFGAYLTPALLSTGGNHEIFLFSYLLVIAAGLTTLLRVKAWSRLLLGALPMTAFYFIAWYSENFAPAERGITLVFALLLWAAFAAVPLVAVEAEGGIVGVLTPLGAAAFGALTVYSVLVDSNAREWEPWCAVAFAAVYLGIMRVRRETVASAMHLSIGVVFLIVAIPLKATGRGITAGWLAEAVALLWVSSLPQVDLRAVRVLRGLACLSLLLGVGGALMGPWIFGSSGEAFRNRDFATSMGACAALAVAMNFALHIKDDGRTRLSGRAILVASLLLVNLVLVVAMHREIFKAVGTAEYADFAFSGWMLLQGAVQLAIGFWKKFALTRWLGLVLLGVAAVKAFAYDIRNLGTGYRVASYLGLGVVLMVVSFAYQKNWLTPPDETAAEAEAAK